TSVGAGCTPQGACVVTGCTPQGACVVTTSTTTTSAPNIVVFTTTTTTSTTLPCGNGILNEGEECDPGSPGTIAPCAGGISDTTCACRFQTLDFTTGVPGGRCGTAEDGAATVVRDLKCGGLNIGGGSSQVPEASVPTGSTSRFALSCSGSSCTIAGTATPP